MHGVPGQEGGGPRLDHGGPAGAPQELDTGQKHPQALGEGDKLQCEY